MWLSQKASSAVNEADTGQGIGQVTIGGEQPGVLTDCENRYLSVASPGGYVWRPKAGQQVLVMKCPDGTNVAAGAVEQSPATELENGEVCIMSDGGAWIAVKNDGSVQVTGSLTVDGDLSVAGTVSVNGSLYVNGERYRPCACV